MGFEHVEANVLPQGSKVARYDKKHVSASAPKRWEARGNGEMGKWGKRGKRELKEVKKRFSL
jgi:hypothetical protein